MFWVWFRRVVTVAKYVAAVVMAAYVAGVAMWLWWPT